jgi:hypothetical protein
MIKERIGICMEQGKGALPWIGMERDKCKQVLRVCMPDKMIRVDEDTLNALKRIRFWYERSLNTTLKRILQEYECKNCTKVYCDKHKRRTL